MAGDKSDPNAKWKLAPKIRRQLEAALAGNLDTSHELDRALASEPGAVALLWRRISDDKANIAEKDLWVSEVAKRVVKDVLTVDAKDRPRAALKAIGFYGTLDQHWNLKFDVAMLLDFVPGLSRSQIAERMQARGHLEGKSLKEVMKTIDRLRTQSSD